MTETTSFGAALTAGKTIGLWDLKDHKSIPIYNETYYCTLPEDGKRNFSRHLNFILIDVFKANKPIPIINLDSIDILN